MKTINLKKVVESIPVNGKTQDIEISTIDLLETSINAPVKGGYSASDIMVRIKLLQVLKSAKESNATSVSFEDADFKALQVMVAESRWSVISNTILEFCQEVEKQ